MQYQYHQYRPQPERVLETFILCSPAPPPPKHDRQHTRLRLANRSYPRMSMCACHPPPRYLCVLARPLIAMLPEPFRGPARPRLSGSSVKSKRAEPRSTSSRTRRNQPRFSPPVRHRCDPDSARRRLRPRQAPGAKTTRRRGRALHRRQPQIVDRRFPCDSPAMTWPMGQGCRLPSSRQSAGRFDDAGRFAEPDRMHR